MKKDEWLTAAKKLSGVCSTNHKSGNGSTKCTTAEAKKATELNHTIGSHHGIHETAYSALGESLMDMINLVKAGKKDEFFSDTKKGK
jgi:hypothetical protein